MVFQNDELKDLIKKMLDSANLEEVTMKTVLKDVSTIKLHCEKRRSFNPESAKQIMQQTTFLFFYLYLLKKIRLDFSCESC